MATASYLVEGRGDARAYASCSHGAGRTLTRQQARAQITLGDLRRQLREVVYPLRLERTLLEEAPGAYKDLDRVLREQTDLVRPLKRLRPLLVL